MPARRAPHLFSQSVAFLAALGSALPAKAETGLIASTWAQEATEGVGESLESPELRSLRLIEDELFGGGSPDAPEAYDPDCVYGTPDSMTSEAPPAKLERPEGPVDLSFLSELKQPSLPVRWDSRVIEYLLFFKDDKRGRELMGAWLKRMERYGPMIRRVLAEHSLPQDLQFVAMVESGYDPLARSIADAQGMWQFVKQAGSYYGLRIDHWTDERLDPEASTRAAARYMRDLYDRFGSWELAFAAYNMGYGGLLRAIRKYNTNDYWLLSHLEAGLPYETSLYVAKITAVALVANNPEKFGFEKLSMEPTLNLAKVDVPPGTPLGPIASAAGIDREQLEKLNPHLKRARVSPGDSAPNVYIPKDQYTRFAERWSKNKEPAQHVSYVLRFGETFDEVARRHNISGTRLREINQLDSDAKVGAGFAMLVPAGAEVTTLNGQMPVATVPEKTFQYEGRHRVFYRVASQDTPDAVARFFDVTVDELLAWNNLAEGATLQRDMLVQLFVREDLDLGRAVVLSPDQVRILIAGTDEFFDFHETQRGRVRVRYRVQAGDTMQKVADKFELSAGSVGRINQFATNKELTPDSWIVVYVPEKQVPDLEKKGLVARISDKPQAETAPASAPQVAAPVEEEVAEDAMPPKADGKAETAPVLPSEESAADPVAPLEADRDADAKVPAVDAGATSQPAVP